MRNRWLISAAKVINLSGADGQYYAEYSRDYGMHTCLYKKDATPESDHSVADYVVSSLADIKKYSETTGIPVC